MGGRNFEEEFGQALLFVSPTPHYVARETKIEPDRRLSIALNYIQRSSPNPPKALVKALNGLKKRDDIFITKPDKGSGVVVMDKTDYIRLLSAASVDNTSKFIHVDDKRPKSRGRPSKQYHPLLQKDKELRTTLREILPEEIANTLSPQSSGLHISTAFLRLTKPG